MRFVALRTPFFLFPSLPSFFFFHALGWNDYLIKNNVGEVVFFFLLFFFFLFRVMVGRTQGLGKKIDFPSFFPPLSSFFPPSPGSSPREMREITSLPLSLFYRQGTNGSAFGGINEKTNVVNLLFFLFFPLFILARNRWSMKKSFFLFPPPAPSRDRREGLPVGSFHTTFFFFFLFLSPPV